MPADDILTQAPSAKHGNGDTPYPCSQAVRAPGATWAINYGFCRHSLDQLAGRDDGRCPTDCQHKAPGPVAEKFIQVYSAEGNAAAAAYSWRARQHANATNETSADSGAHPITG